MPKGGVSLAEKRDLNPMRDRLRLSLITLVMRAPWEFIVLVLRLMYGFRVKGLENIPTDGPLVLLIREPSLIGVLVSGWISIRVRLQVLKDRQDKSVQFMQETLYAIPYFRSLLSRSELGRYSSLVSHSAGRMALGLVDGYRVLLDGGLTILNPQGEGAWHGRPLPTGHSVAWLSLHTGAPILPAVCSIGAYDIWPRWSIRPSLRGRLELTIGEPIQLVDTPLKQVTPQQLDEASAHIAAQVERLCYGPGGVPDWVGEPMRGGRPVEGQLRVRLPEEEAASARAEFGRQTAPSKGEQPSAWKRGIAQLLWRCPVCAANDALVQERRWFKPPILRCRACRTQWVVRRYMRRDFRLEVVDGPPHLMGVDMALSSWYDAMLQDLEPHPISVSGLDLLPGEQVYLAADDVSLTPHRPNPLLEDWAEREAPQEQPPGRPEMADWASLGSGRLLLTSQRLVWQGTEREVDFRWSAMRAIYLWLINTVGINYGSARYRMTLGREVGLKWLSHLAMFAREASERGGHRLTVSPF